MKAIVSDACIGCGLCCGTCPQVFTMGEDGLAHGGSLAPEQLDAAREAENGCPVSAIRIES